MQQEAPTYQQIPAPEALRGFVRYFWILRSGTEGPRVLRPVADGCPGLIFHWSEKGRLTDKAGLPLPGLFLYGQTIRPRELHAPLPFSAAGAVFYPSALRSLFRLDAQALTDTCLPVQELFPAGGAEPRERGRSLSGSGDPLPLLAAFLQTEAKRAAPEEVWLRYTIQQLSATEGIPDLANLRRQLHLTERTFERRFRQHVGIPPRLFARICRFQSGLQQLRSGRYRKLSDLAFDNGYADQSHFIRAFREFAGPSPLRYLAAEQVPALLTGQDSR